MVIIREVMIFSSLILTFFSTDSFSKNITFTNYGGLQGFEQTALLDISQDYVGNMWLSSEFCIMRYDGTNIDRYKYSSKSSNTITKGLIRKIVSDSSNRLWVLTTKGLSRYDFDKDFFYPYINDFDFQAKSLIEIDKTYFLLLTNIGCRFFNSLTNSVDVQDNDISRLHCDAAIRFEDCLILGTTDGVLCKYNLKSKALEYLAHLPYSISTIIDDVNGHGVWFGTSGGGLYYYDLKTGSINNIAKGNDHKSLSSNRVRSLCYDCDGFLWIGTTDGLNILDGKTGIIEKYYKDIYNDKSLSHSTVRRIFRDSQGGMWLSTYYGGFNYYHPLRSKFNSLSMSKGQQRLNDNIVNCIVEGSDDLIWIGTNKGGLNCLNQKTGNMSYYKISGVNRQGNIEYNDIKSVYLDSSGRYVWIGAYRGGLNLLDKHTMTMSNINSPASIYVILDAGSDCLFLGSLEGVFLFDKTTYHSSRLCDDSVISIFIDTQRRLWAVTRDGVKVYAIDERMHLSQIAFDAIENLAGACDVFESSGSELFIYGRCGIFSIDFDARTIYPIDISGDLSMASAVGMVEADSYLWISTHSGLFRYSLIDKSSRRFSAEDGLSLNCFSEHAYCRLKSGEILFGGIGGICRFFPDELPVDNTCSNPEIKSISINGKLIVPGDDSRILSNCISRTSEIKLYHKHSNIVFGFASPDFDLSARIWYRLDGLDSQWYLADDMKAKFTNLPKGKFSLIVRSINKDGLQCSKDTVLKLRVYPVWYKTTIAIIIEILLCVVIIILIVLNIIKQNDIKNELKLSQLEKEYQHEIQRLKAFKFVNSGIVQQEKSGGPVKVLTSEDESFLTKAILLVENNMSNPDLTTDLLAKEMNMSRTSFHLKIKYIAGVSSLDFIRKVRYSRACQLLKESNFTISEIGYQVGANSPSAFCESFKTYIGCTPKEYIQSSKSID